MRNSYWYVDDEGSAVDTRKVTGMEHRGVTPHSTVGYGFLQSYKVTLEGEGSVTLRMREPQEFFDLVRYGPGGRDE